MRASYIFFFAVSVVFLVLDIGLVIIRAINGPTNILFPGLGLVVSLDLIISSVLIVNLAAFCIAMILRSRMMKVR